MRFLIVFSLVLASHKTFSSIDDYFPQSSPTSSKYGNTGLIEIPSARFMKEGSLKLGISASYPNEFTFITASPFSWLEATYRYSEIKNQLYGPRSFSGNQTWKDKGFDIKFLLTQETYLKPSIAIGFRDIAGTGAFSSEYFVATKELGDFDLSLGLGWGNLGQLGTISNPFIEAKETFADRNSFVGIGGTFNHKDWFSGQETSVFGGLEYKLKKYGLRIKLEYDTSKPDTGYGRRFPENTQSRFNVGLAYNISNFADVEFSFERGNQFRFTFAFRGNFTSSSKFEKNDPPISINKQKKINHSSEEFMISSLNELKKEDIFLQGGSFSKDSIEVSVSQARFRSQPLAIGRAARILSKLSSPKLETIHINIMNGDLETSSLSISNDSIKKVIDQTMTINELLLQTKITSETGNQNYHKQDFLPKVNFPEVSWSMSPALKHHIGGPEGFYLGQLWWKLNSNIKFSRGLSLSTVLGFDIYNNFDELRNSSNSTLPHVRSDIQEYLKEGETNIARMKLDYIWSPKDDWFARLDIGLIEEMFGGLGGEILYRPFNSLFAIGFTGHYVRQREYKQRFGFRDYKVLTGHMNSYFKLPGDLLLQIHAGKYLAKDNGLTLDISRRFNTGFRLGIFATKTNISSKEFGEGSFDKGFYFNIPLDLFYQDYKTGNISFSMHPLTRDGGAMLSNHNSLYGIFGDTTKDTIYRDFKDIIR